MHYLSITRTPQRGGIFYIFMVLLSWCCWSGLANKECHVGSLPKDTIKINNVHIINLEEAGDFFLSCRCTIYQPLWQVYKLSSHEISGIFNGNVSCMNTSRSRSSGVDASSGSCNTNTVFLSEEEPGIIVKTDNSFHINQSTILMCYASVFREIVIFNMMEEDLQLEDYLSSGDSSSILEVISSTYTTSTSSLLSSPSIVGVGHHKVSGSSTSMYTRQQQSLSTSQLASHTSSSSYSSREPLFSTTMPSFHTSPSSDSVERVDGQLLSEREIYLSVVVLVIIVISILIITILVISIMCMKIKHSNALKHSRSTAKVAITCDDLAGAASTENLLYNSQLSLAERKPTDGVKRSFSASTLMFVNPAAFKNDSL